MEDDPAEVVALATERVQRQRALVVELAKAKQFDNLPAVHQVLRQMEDTLKLARMALAHELSTPN